jgi:hypothetical protein
MSQVTKPGGAGAAGAPARRDAGEPSTRAGEFEALLKDKSHESRPAASGTPSPPAALAGAGHRGRKDGEASDPPRAEDAWRGLPGDLASPGGRRPEPGALELPGAARTAEAVARIERIAEQILRSVEVRLGADGAASARLELDLGGLGRLRVAFDRTAEGTVAIRFEGAAPEAARLLVDHGADLVARLEARGLALGEVALASSEGPLVRLGPAPEPQADEAARRSAAAERTAPREEAERGRPDDERQRRQQAAVLPDDED